ncbi:hypothetical protein Avbf_04760 [Armadillidium vulgare]|nr:hypothetical protein Avbf_04760 [Armadillidium vulgare]
MTIFLIMATYNNKHISFQINDSVTLSGFHDIIKKNFEISPTEDIELYIFDDDFKEYVLLVNMATIQNLQKIEVKKKIFETFVSTGTTGAGNFRTFSSSWICKFTLPDFGIVTNKLSRSLAVTRSDETTIVRSIFTEVQKFTLYPKSSEYTTITKCLLSKYPSLGKNFEAEVAEYNILEPTLYCNKYTVLEGMYIKKKLGVLQIPLELVNVLRFVKLFIKSSQPDYSFVELWKGKIIAHFQNHRHRHLKTLPVVQQRMLTKKRKNGPMDETLMSPPNKRSAVWGLTNYLPGRELGENDCTIREHTEFLQLEFKKLRPNYDRVNSSMTATLSDRRHKIVVDHSPIAEVIETWPWLKDENEEFTRISNLKNVENILRESLIKLSKPLKSMQHKYVSRYSGTVKDVIEKFEEIRDAEEKDESFRLGKGVIEIGKFQNIDLISEGNLKSTKFIFTTFIGINEKIFIMMLKLKFIAMLKLNP